MNGIIQQNWKFRVQVSTLPGETICVVGNCRQLGDWKVDDAVILTREIGYDEDQELWSCVVNIPANTNVEYRYFRCIVVEPDGIKDVTREIIIRQWETNLLPRVVQKNATSNIDREVLPEIFGQYLGMSRTEAGWVSRETVVQLKLYNNPVKIFKKKYQGKTFFIKVTPIDLRRSHSLDSVSLSMELEESVDAHELRTAEVHFPLVEVAVMNKDQCHFRLQDQFGHKCGDGDMVVFQCQTLLPDMTAFLVDFYIESHHAEPFHAGFSYILPSNLQSTIGITVIPITSMKHTPIGEITVDYLTVQPFKDFACDMSISYARHWKHTWKGLDVGHRGAGSSHKPSFKSCANIRENTIASLNYAASHGADFVEFDVQLSKDLVPVIYHDFHVRIALKRKFPGDNDFLQLPVKDLTVEQLHQLKIYNLLENNADDMHDGDDHLEDHQPFPLLQKALEVIDEHVGFNIEIKWTMKLKDGTYELYHPFELNVYLDCVLKTVLQYGGSRKIVFSCFHPDICTIVRLKQNKYPVLFLTQGITQKYPAYNDPRTHDIPMAVYFAQSAGILGINVHTEDILRDASQVKIAQEAGLIVFCWGDDNNDSHTIKYLKELGLHGIIYDRIDEFNPKPENIFVAEARDTEKQLVEVAKGNPDCTSFSGISQNTS